jgi:hypothetical protein
MGLLTGAAISLIGAMAYFYGGMKMPGDGLPSLYIGGSLVALGLIHFTYGSNTRGVRFAINTMFPIGAFLILASIEQRTQSTKFGLFVLLIITFWIIARLMLARWDHVRICGSCEPGCSFQTNF